MTSLKIEMVHDLVCSWCPIGYNYLVQALRNLDLSAQWGFLPFELNPAMTANGEDIEAHLRRRYGWSSQQHDRYRVDLTSKAAAAGVEIDFDKRTRYFNTHLAHRLMHLAEQQNSQLRVRSLLVDAYFRRGLNISKADVLLGVASQVGLDRSEVETMLMSETTPKDVNAKIAKVKQLGIFTTPTFIFNGNTVMTGSNTVDDFESFIASLSANR